MDYAAHSLAEHERLKGKLELRSKAPLTTKEDLSTFYTPGIAAVSSAIAEDPAAAWKYTWRGNTVAVISDGSAVLGLGNIGALAAQPVMAGKAAIFKEFAGIDAVPIVLDTQDPEELIKTIRYLAPSFGGINLEDIAAPACFAIETALQDLGIPVMHDDQHGTAVVAAAALKNACTATGRSGALRVVINGAGAGGTAIAEMLLTIFPEIKIIMVDSKGIISSVRHDLNEEKQQLRARTNPDDIAGGLVDALNDADVFIGVSRAGALPAEHIARMAANPIIFALANPVPEIMPEDAKTAGAAVVATGRSDYPNQVNNALAFPGIFRGALDAGAIRITKGMLAAAVDALASFVKEPDANRLLPGALEPGVTTAVAQAVAQAARSENVTRN